MLREVRAWGLNAGVALLSIGLAAFGPGNDFGLAGWVYLLLPILLPWDAWRSHHLPEES